MSLNKAMLIGNLGKDPESRSTQSGMAVCSFSLATNERKKSKDGGWEDHVEWHNIVCFDKTAEAVLKFCQKGKQVFVEGRIQTEKWTDKNGVDRWTTKIIAESVHFLGGGNGGDRDGQRQDRQSGRDEEIPF